MCRNAVRLAFMLMLAMPPLSLAQQNDSELPLEIEADRAELNEVTGIGIYRGDVRVTQGGMVLNAATVTVIAPGRRLQKIIAQGDKSTFRQTVSGGNAPNKDKPGEDEPGESGPGEDVLWAEALRMEYEPHKHRITLLGDAFLRRAKNDFAAERIVYDIRRRVVDADDPKHTGRVKMTLVPEDADDGDDSPATR
ncbi:MAG: lipopolysaccharide transport periplasmic protein LptA [Gammaproteobacteria bacterium]|nr:lipopolysaccharide transport periplasmic protein LptA [Gammaproteobacteria bacterium]MBA3731346.1 lipopolysaccharide transport periplasmic protein LptA [Gammaproteobacteria bacterium]